MSYLNTSLSQHGWQGSNGTGRVGKVIGRWSVETACGSDEHPDIIAVASGGRSRLENRRSVKLLLFCIEATSFDFSLCCLSLLLSRAFFFCVVELVQFSSILPRGLAALSLHHSSIALRSIVQTRQQWFKTSPRRLALLPPRETLSCSLVPTLLLAHWVESLVSGHYTSSRPARANACVIHSLRTYPHSSHTSRSGKMPSPSGQ